VKLIKVLIAINWIFWPTALFLVNTKGDFINYLIPALLIVLSYFIYRKKTELFIFPLLFIPLFIPKLTIIPLIASILSLVFEKTNSKMSVLFIIFAVFLTMFYSKNLYGQSIFPPDYEKQQEVIMNSQLYPNVLTARIFNNKGRIIFDKFTSNFFALTDPNNYFFGYHPQEIVGNQNLKKFPSLSLLFFLYALYKIKEHKNKLFIFLTTTAAVMGLSFLALYDRNDFILWPIVSIVVTYGITKLYSDYKTKQKSLKNIFFGGVLFFSLIEYVQLIISKV
jgi:hypothetical protein